MRHFMSVTVLALQGFTTYLAFPVSLHSLIRWFHSLYWAFKSLTEDGPTYPCPKITLFIFAAISFLQNYFTADIFVAGCINLVLVCSSSGEDSRFEGREQLAIVRLRKAKMYKQNFSLREFDKNV